MLRCGDCAKPDGQKRVVRAGNCKANPKKAAAACQIEFSGWTGYFPDPNTIDKTSEVKMADGSIMKFEFKGKRT